jgi:hypothetical protein
MTEALRCDVRERCTLAPVECRDRPERVDGALRPGRREEPRLAHGVLGSSGAKRAVRSPASVASVADLFAPARTR